MDILSEVDLVFAHCVAAVLIVGFQLDLGVAMIWDGLLAHADFVHGCIHHEGVASLGDVICATREEF